jgi:hypothetical protein
VTSLAGRLTTGWDDGFGVGARVALGAASVAYRGALAARGLLYASRGVGGGAGPCGGGGEGIQHGGGDGE